jgi:putative phosphoesterase
MLKIAIFSDIHANLPALKAVLDDISSQQADQVYCLGDLVDFAPWPNEVINLIRENKISTIMGNHDERIAFDLPLITLKKHSHDETAAREQAIDFTRRTISKENKLFISLLPRHIKLSFLFNSLPFNILLVHGSSRSIDEYLYEDHDQGELIRMMEEAEADVMVGGHTHLSYIRNLAGTNARTMINCGSVGRTKERNGEACYLMITLDSETKASTINYELRKLPYDIQKTIQGIKSSRVPDFYADFLEKTDLGC